MLHSKRFSTSCKSGDDGLAVMKIRSESEEPANRAFHIRIKFIDVDFIVKILARQKYLCYGYIPYTCFIRLNDL